MLSTNETAVIYALLTESPDSADAVQDLCFFKRYEYEDDDVPSGLRFLAGRIKTALSAYAGRELSDDDLTGEDIPALVMGLIRQKESLPGYLARAKNALNTLIPGYSLAQDYAQVSLLTDYLEQEKVDRWLEEDSEDIKNNILSGFWETSDPVSISPDKPYSDSPEVPAEYDAGNTPPTEPPAEDQNAPEQNDNAEQFLNETDRKPLPAGAGKPTASANERLPTDPYGGNHDLFAADITEKFKKYNKNFKVSDDIKTYALYIPAMLQSIRGIENMFEDFPWLKNSLTMLAVVLQGDVLMETSFEGVIYFRSNRYDSLYNAKYRSWSRRTISGRFKSVAERLISGGEHEVAHLIERELILRNKEYRDYEERRRAWLSHKEAKKIIDEAYELAKKELDWKNRSRDELIAEISPYAELNDSEALAEGITDYRYNAKQGKAGQAKLLSRIIYRIAKNKLGG